MRIALYQPDIPQNTGTILRLAACLAMPVDIIGPTGFDMSERALRRAALDYLEYVNIDRHVSFEKFLEAQNFSRNKKLVLLTTHGTIPYFDFEFSSNDTLLLGRESAGVPKDVHQCVNARIKIPMHHNLRSVNIAVATSMVLGEALRQTQGFPKSMQKED
ncbi:MAG: tRNA (cytidine(34)-2'-O)-methyltransferase [Pseudomonadota bacterium]